MPLPHHWTELTERLHTNLCFPLGASIFRNYVVFEFECLRLACCIGSRFDVCCITTNKLMANCSQLAVFSQIPSMKTSYVESKQSLGCLGNFSTHYCDTVHFIQQISQTSPYSLERFLTGKQHKQAAFVCFWKCYSIKWLENHSNNLINQFVQFVRATGYTFVTIQLVCITRKFEISHLKTT